MAKQIGNAVPPLLAKELASKIAAHLDTLPIQDIQKSRKPLTIESFNTILSEVIETVLDEKKDSEQLELAIEQV